MNDVISILETSEEIAEIAKALPKAQAAMGDVFKTAVNPAFRSKYANLANVIEAVVPALNANGLSLLQPAAFDGEFVRVATMFLHESGQWMRCTVSVVPAKKDAQGIGSAQTYLRRYGLMSMSGVAPEDDDGNAASNSQRQQREQQDQEPVRMARKSSAQAKRDQDDERIKAIIQAIDSEDALDLWVRQRFDIETKDIPMSWLDPIRDEVERHRDTLKERQKEFHGAA